MTIDLSVKKRCAELSKQGLSSRQIFDTYFSKIHDSMGYETFRHKLRNWKSKQYVDDTTLEAGTYPNFIAHNATVQVSNTGEIVQAWIKQTAEESQIDKLIEAIKENISPTFFKVEPKEETESMLEIPLFDMHFPLCEYFDELHKINEIVSRQQWNEINIIVGQDLFHNDDFRGRTSSGRPIEKVDMVRAWTLAATFYFNLISNSIKQAGRVNLIYSKGNHDESLAWAFVQLLKTQFPDLCVDDTFKQRKHIFWNGCFIGVTHGSNRKTRNEDLRGQFTIEFSESFSSSKVREIHVGHLHHERDADCYGVMIRRLGSGVEDDTWSDDEGYVGAHKRFMLFEYSPDHLKSIHYI